MHPFPIISGSPNKIFLNYINGFESMLGNRDVLHDVVENDTKRSFGKSSSPNHVEKLNFPPLILEFMESRMKWKSLFLGLLWKMGKPRYLPKSTLSLI